MGKSGAEGSQRAELRQYITNHTKLANEATEQEARACGRRSEQLGDLIEAVMAVALKEESSSSGWLQDQFIGCDHISKKVMSDMMKSEMLIMWL